MYDYEDYEEESYIEYGEDGDPIHCTFDGVMRDRIFER